MSIYLTFILTFVLGFGLTYFGVHYFRLYSIAKNWLDVPNERSSHTSPTPRGGGIVIVAICLMGYTLLALFGELDFVWGYFIGALLIAIVSWLDDLYSLSFVWRLCIQLLSASLLIYSIAPSLNDSFATSIYSGGAIAISIIGIVWIVNAYNFMDGIDGIAGLQAGVAAASWALLTWSFAVGLSIYSMLVFAAAIGFLFHNWSPARVFMGDVGSAFLGFTFASLPFLSLNFYRSDTHLLPIFAILTLWPFIFDTAFTLITRILKRQRIWQAHREHLYQRLVKQGYSHLSTASLYGTFAFITSAAAFSLISGLTGPMAVSVTLVAVSIGFALFVLSTSRVAHS